MTRAINSHRGYLSLSAAACVALVAAILLGGSPDSVIADQPKKVGKVISIEGGKLQVRVGGEGAAKALEEADGLHLGDEIVPNKGVEATLRVNRPAGVADEQLVYVDPKPGENEYTVTMTRIGKQTTLVTIVESTD